jgi:hypothetical protein
MSVSTRVPKTYECARDECENSCDEVTSVEGSYCSRRCYQLERGRKLLNLIEHDHRFCAGCYHQLKEIERPDGETHPPHTGGGVETVKIEGADHIDPPKVHPPPGASRRSQGGRGGREPPSEDLEAWTG